MSDQRRKLWGWLGATMVVMLILAGCGGGAKPTTSAAQNPEATGESVTPEGTQPERDMLPELSPLLLNGEKVQAVATTNLVGDAVAQIGRDNIELTTLLAPGVDPHSYQLAPADRQKLEDADVIFINGLGLEEGMLPVLDDLKGRVPIVPVSAGIETIAFGGDEGDAGETQTGEAQGGVDPHSWQSASNVMVWAQNIATALKALDPTHADAYSATASAYRSQLEILNGELHQLADSLPQDQRRMVTDHDSLGYFAHEYGFDLIGTVIPSLSTDASASAQDLAALQDQIRQEGVKAIFVGTTVNPQLAQQLAADLGIKVVPIYSDSLSEADGPTATYLDFMRHNMQTIVDGLR